MCQCETGRWTLCFGASCRCDRRQGEVYLHYSSRAGLCGPVHQTEGEGLHQRAGSGQQLSDQPDAKEQRCCLTDARTHAAPHRRWTLNRERSEPSGLVAGRGNLPLSCHSLAVQIQFDKIPAITNKPYLLWDFVGFNRHFLSWDSTVASLFLQIQSCYRAKYEVKLHTAGADPVTLILFGLANTDIL